MRELAESLKKSGLVQWFEPAREAEIGRAERDLELRFPKAYREFLSTCGVMLIATIPLPRTFPLPLSKIPGRRTLERAGLGDPETPIHDRFIFGLGRYARDHVVESVVLQNRVARKSAQIMLPRHLLAIWDDWRFYLHCLDLSREKRGDCPVVCYEWETFQRKPLKPREVAPSFRQWMIDRVETQSRMSKKVLATLAGGRVKSTRKSR